MMRKALGVLALVLALTCSAQAGYMQNGSPEPPPPQPAPAVQGPTTDGEIDTGVTAATTDGEIPNNATITIVEVVLNLLALS